nr:MAG TPA: hypothetical protein [Caudoviricetes sp.]
MIICGTEKCNIQISLFSGALLVRGALNFLKPATRPFNGL